MCWEDSLSDILPVCDVSTSRECGGKTSPLILILPVFDYQELEGREWREDSLSDLFLTGVYPVVLLEMCQLLEASVTALADVLPLTWGAEHGGQEGSRITWVLLCSQLSMRVHLNTHSFHV
ncbi:hypothetical protein RRG08_003484 [Elysia crispata]|uniref:Uncharacterized protein n=1 Tax=Elysia crispata TaxID=231223 RepID=A0AAE1CT97_9GAST|nr:hypothetical protein RRG08_003484 [Elysia crispata]